MNPGGAPSQRISGLAASFLFAPFIIIAFFNWPSADDYDFAQMVQTHGFWGSQRFWYFAWTGRFASNFLNSLNPLVFRMPSLNFVPPLIGLILLCSMAVHLANLAGLCFNSSRLKERITLILIILFLFDLTSLAEGLYWYTGLTTYLIPFSLAIIVCCRLISLLRVGIAPTVTARLWLFGSGILLAGFNEIILLLLTVFCAGLAFAWLRRPHRTYFAAISPFIFGVGLGGVAMLLSPGNLVRRKVLLETGQHLTDHLQAWRDIAFFSASSWTLPLVTCCFLVLPFCLHRQVRFPLRRETLALLGMLLASEFLLGLLILGPTEFALGYFPPYRVRNLYVLGHHLVALAFVGLLYDRYGRPGSPGPRQQRLSIIVFGISILFTPNMKEVFVDTLPRLAKYRAELAARESLLEHSSGEELTLPSFSAAPESIFFTDIDADPSDSKNRSFAHYYRLKSVRRTSGENK